MNIMNCILNHSVIQLQNPIRLLHVSSTLPGIAKIMKKVLTKTGSEKNFSAVNIYWIARGTNKDNEIEELLKTHVGSLRHELAQLKVVGVIPQLQFVKDKSYAITAELDRLLALADFGDDYVPIDLATRLTTQLELTSALDSHTVDKIKTLDKEDPTEEDDEFEEALPPMPQNIFNLNHSEIMERIIKSKKKSQAPQSLSLENEYHSMATSINENIIQFTNNQDERKAFNDFLRKRQVVRDQFLKEDQKYHPDLDCLREEVWEKQQQNFTDIDNTLEENDYIDEEIEKKSFEK